MSIGGDKYIMGPFIFTNTREDPQYDLKFWLGGKSGVNIWLDSVWVKEKVESAINEKNTGLAVDYSLEQNYPNPFNPATNIIFTLPEAANVRMEIYNLTGQKINTLTDNDYSAGSYILTWNGDDSNGVAVPSGMYVYKIVAQGRNNIFTQTKKMLFLK
ncbi:T9SS type A sorting domain-containing protein [candidate division KSB1 bacterium]|nr:T9SS type A sorting domain-containing protein [candidate division KSB1 bacterium]